MVPFSVSALHHRYCFFVFLQPFHLCILQGNLDVLWYDGHTLGVYGVEMRWYHFSSVFSLCFFTTDSAVSDTLSPCFLHYVLLMLPFIPILLTSFYVSATWVFILINLWSSGFSPFQAIPAFHSLDLFQLTHFIHINFIIFSFPAASTSSSISSLS